MTLAQDRGRRLLGPAPRIIWLDLAQVRLRDDCEDPGAFVSIHPILGRKRHKPNLAAELPYSDLSGRINRVRGAP